ncbi:MAG: hypothetical protein KAZ14_02850 [Nitrosomonas sp.]|nr:hypothetical protein [Nitrosomonas sp.]
MLITWKLISWRIVKQVIARWNVQSVNRAASPRLRAWHGKIKFQYPPKENATSQNL